MTREDEDTALALWEEDRDPFVKSNPLRLNEARPRARRKPDPKTAAQTRLNLIPSLSEIRAHVRRRAGRSSTFSLPCQIDT